MSKYSKELMAFHISQIRKVLVMMPNASSREISDILAKQKNPLILTWIYINKLKNKIMRERAERYNHFLVNQKISAFEDKVREIDSRLWNILSDPQTTSSEKVMALREIRKNDEALIQKMADAGVFERKLGEVNILTPAGVLRLLQKDVDERTNTNNKKVDP
jgi:hypothetical protein